MIENWGVRTAAQNEATFKQLVEVIGDVPTAAVTKSVVRDFFKPLITEFLHTNYDIVILDEDSKKSIIIEATHVILNTNRGRIRFKNINDLFLKLYRFYKPQYRPTSV